MGEVPGEQRVAVVVEDDDDISYLIGATLAQAGFTVHTAATGTAGVEAVRTHDPLVTTLDISLPDIDGIEVARRVRTFSATYLVMLTARAEEVDTLLGLEVGADDYVTKPFRPRELRARIEAMLRRPRQLVRGGGAAGAPLVGTGPATGATVSATVAHGGSGPPPVLRHGPLTVDTAARLVDLDGAPVHLTRSEFDLLAALVAEPSRVLRKGELVRHVWGEEYATGLEVTAADLRSLEVHVANLRRKLGEDASQPRFIETVRGVGYRLRPVG
ncbi:response regulator transcription factor [Georgenia sp. TF02-10]|uniref:response regulator transcription factor n=1 Tax=Georgenia sp. TF02-10 TaxID=2917725 RepID=UPI001FA7EA53|nr:response regulator transcription factor [Georgenia sp. TF02-10]UNX55356.1 response regulator transcription factor [Georgenia sp. TF02-10]